MSVFLTRNKGQGVAINFDDLACLEARRKINFGRTKKTIVYAECVAWINAVFAVVGH